MREFVGENGQAGWGTWCVREFREGGGGDGDGDGDEEGNHGMASRQPMEEIVKVYCWGEVVGEIWLLLWVGSKRKVDGVGARWVDAGGVAVVMMK